MRFPRMVFFIPPFESNQLFLKWEDTMNKKMTTQMIVEGGVLMALAFILSQFKLFTMPQGGSVTPGSMVPIIIFAIRWGAKPGVLMALTYGILQFILGPKWSFHPVSILFDYVFAVGILGFAGAFGPSLKKALPLTILAILGRLVFSVISGVIVFGSYTPEGMNVVWYSLTYNGSYMIPELALTTVVVALL